MNLAQIVIILCHPDSSQNIGSVCRAMLNMGISNLRIIGNKTDYNEEQIQKLSIHAYSVWETTKFYKSLNEATIDCCLTAGTTRRKGKKRKPCYYYPEEFSEKISTISSGNIAIIFGNERTGLTDTELDICTIGITIPSNKEFASLNLSHAVQIITYSIYTKATRKNPGYKTISLERIDKAVNTILQSFTDVNFFKFTGQKKMTLYWRSIISRAALSEQEVSFVEKTFKKLSGIHKKLSRKTNITSEQNG